MTELRWTLDRTFFDAGRGFRAEGPGVYDVPEEHVERYLAHRSGGWEQPDADDSEDEDDVDEEPEEISDDELLEVLDGTNDEVAEELETGAYDDHLDRLEELERDGEERKGALTAIDDRRED